MVSRAQSHYHCFSILEITALFAVDADLQFLVFVLTCIVRCSGSNKPAENVFLVQNSMSLYDVLDLFARDIRIRVFLRFRDA